MEAIDSTRTHKRVQTEMAKDGGVDSIASNANYSNTLEVADHIRNDYGEAVYDFLLQHVDLSNATNLLLDTTTRFNLIKEARDDFKAIVNLKRINDIRYVNKFFEAVNAKLPVGGTFIGCVETKNLRKKRILGKYPIGINYIAYSIDFVVKRVMPKLRCTRKLYFFLTRGQNRVMTRAETLGRLISCGFEIKEEKKISGRLYFVVEKVGDPKFPEDPTYGALVRLRRVGKDGKLFNVYKLRTMHPFAEYLQDYVYKQNELQEGGKFKDDFRVSTLGKIFRKLWIDELPMLRNLLKGQMKLVGVRPLSEQYFNLYSEELQQKRIKYKPGLVPPFYADMPKTMDEIMASEMKYLEAYEKSPFKTDWKYFWMAFNNIVFKKARSS